MFIRLGLAVSALALCAQPSSAQDFSFDRFKPEAGGKLRLTRGVSTVEGQGGGGLAPWALITGDETDRGIGATSHATVVELPDYGFKSYGVAVGFYDRVELSYTRQQFDTRDVGAALGLGQGFTFGQDVYGAKVRVIGNAVYDQDTWVPQVAVGANWKTNDQDATVLAVGAADSEGWETYASATKILLDASILINGTLRWTNANQTGLLGYGGNLNADHQLQAEGSIGWLVNRNLVIGGEYRMKPDNLTIAKEDDWLDLYAAWSLTQNLTLTGAYVDLGSIATFENQRGLYLSLQAGF